jgi:hypothetical protein
VSDILNRRSYIGTYKAIGQCRRTRYVSATIVAAVWQINWVYQDTSGSAMVTGFSGNALKLFMGDKKYPRGSDPEDIMNMSLQKPCYHVLKVYD